MGLDASESLTVSQPHGSAAAAPHKLCLPRLTFAPVLLSSECAYLGKMVYIWYTVEYQIPDIILGD